MPDTRWSRVKQIIEAALERAPEQRAEAIQQACGGDRALQAEVESVLKAMEQAGSFVERPAIDALSTPAGSTAGGWARTSERSLGPGDVLGPYRILEFVGAGGMGEVYRARDAKLNRDVALKILPDALAADRDRLARFRREAQLLASLNHQNIGHIYGFEDAGDRHALVLELVEGPTLADVIGGTRGPLDVDDALRIARQIADALEAAHESGVVHRDLKPANVKVRPDGTVKVLDFGLARSIEPARPSSDELMNSPTMTGPGGMTGTGMILGTAPYMSPEQARGKVVDKRADIWAFGCVLFEMLTGKRPFAGDTTADVISAILGREPDWSAVPRAVPSDVRGLLQQCLEKDPKRRLRDIGDARNTIDRLLHTSVSTTTAASPRRRLLRPALWIALAALLAAGAWWVIDVSRTRPIGPLQFTQITNFSDSVTAPTLSADGRLVTFIRGGPFFQNPRMIGQIYVKVLPNGEAVRLTNDPRPKYAPVFTPDGSRVAYTLLDGISWDTWTVSVLGGEPTRILPNASGLTWISDGRVLFSEIKPPGAHMGIVTATEVRADSREIYFPEHERAMAHFSYASPDRKWILIVEMGPGGGFTEPCRLVPFDGSSAGRLVGPQGPCRFAAWSPDGRWMYFGAIVDERSHLWRQAFPNGAPEQITFDPTSEEGIAVAPDGHSLITAVGEQRSSMWIHDDAGDHQITSEGSAHQPVVSRDGKRVFYLQGTDLMQVDLASGKSSNLLPGVSVGFGYDVSPDATEVAFSSNQAIWLASLDRRFPPREVTRGGNQVSFGANGTLIFRQLERNANFLYRINKDGTGRERVLNTPILGKSRVSPDGAWVIVSRAMTEEGAGTQSGGFSVETVAVPIGGGPPRRICAFNCMVGSGWSLDGRWMFVAAGPRGAMIPVMPGQALPALPASGLRSPAEALRLPGARETSDAEQVLIPNSNLSMYVFLKTETRRNLFRIQLR